MKTGEMITSLTDNRDAKFKCANGCIVNPNRDFIIGCDKDGYIKFFEHGEFRDAYFDIHKKLDWEWELIRNQVEFMTAVNSGKRIRPVGQLDFIDVETVLGSFYLTIPLVNGKWEIE